MIETHDRASNLREWGWEGGWAVLVVQKYEESAMTMPGERTRSIIQTREFLVDLSREKTLPEAVRTEGASTVASLSDHR